ncbi:hypothetical protein EV127DRAFT_492584 [Xylaria flabelliformis]|nr:hypothetical protein EV127DRAFT_492584 [Xylaria flabelliformis]
MMEEPCETEDTAASRPGQNLSPPFRLDSNGKAKWGGKSDRDLICSNSKSPVKKTHNGASVLEAKELAIDDRADGEDLSKQTKRERRRIKQRERRQKWRHKGWSIKAEDERDTRQTIPDLPLELPKSETDHLKRAKRHRLSPKERTIAFFMHLFKYDTRPADWDLICLVPGEYRVFPFCQTVLPLSGLSALVWETEYEGQQISCHVGKGLEEVRATLIEKERELIFYGRHLRNKDLISRNWSKYSGNFKNLQLDLVVKILYYGQLVLRRVVEQLEAQIWQLGRYACKGIKSRNWPDQHGYSVIY